MRRRLMRIVAFAGSLGTWLLLGSEAQGVALPVEWELAIQAGAGAARIGVAGTGVAIVDVSGGLGALTSLEVAAGMIATAGAMLDITDPVASPLEGLLLTVANGAGNFAIGSGGHLQGVMPLLGRERICVFVNCDAAPPSNLSVPLTPVGAGGFAYNVGAINLTVAGAAWTTGTAMVAGLGAKTLTGYAHGPASATGSTAQVGGSLQLITPFTIATSIQADGPIASFAFLTLRFVPEPASALLVASGLVALARWGRSRNSSAGSAERGLAEIKVRSAS
jgi:hypothetical protein